MTSSQERKVMGGLGLASIIIAGVTLCYHLGAERLVASGDRVNHAHALMTALAEFSTKMQTVRMATRGYVVTGDPRIHMDFIEGLNDVERSVTALKLAAQDDPHRAKRVREIELMAQKRLEHSQQLVNLHDHSGGIIATVSVLAEYRDDLDDPMNEKVERLLQDTRVELNRREHLADACHEIMFWMLMCGAVVELAFAVAAAGVIRRDIRERRRQSEALAASESTLRSFYDSALTVMGIVEVVDEGDVVFVSANVEAAKLYQKPPEQIVGRRATQLGVPPAIIKLFIAQYRAALVENGPVQFEYERETPRGKRWFRAVVCPLDNAGSKPRFSYVLLDKTERHAAEIALQQHAEELAAAKDALEKQSAALSEARDIADAASRAKSHFLANMSHEIRTPMTAVLGYADLLADADQSEEQRGEWVTVIRRNAEHLLELINDILDLSKIEAGKMQIESVACDPAQLVGDVVEMMRPRAVQKGLDLRLDFDGPVPRQMCSDPLRFRQILVNLLGNAIKFTEAGEVAVRVACDPAVSENQQPSLRIDVRDTGIGMNGEQVSNLFRPFTQADETTTRRFGGTGLGLAITHRLVNLLGGNIDVNSEAGFGSTFRIVLPVRAVADGPPSDETGDAQSMAQPDSFIATRLRGSILIVEDTPDTQRLLMMLLATAGAQVSVAGNGRAGVELATTAATPFDVIVMDMQMPEMDGYAAATELRRRGIGAPIIALTAHAMAGDRERCIDAGCSDYLTKPIDVPLLLRTIARHLDATRAAVAAKVA